jgi:phenylalanyl-tRNA synthetase beta chain
MRISLQWLSEYLPGPLDPRALADALTGGGLPVESVESHGSDTILDVEVTSNRPDCLSYLGVARELAALLNRPMLPPAIEPREHNPQATTVASLRIEAGPLCPHYIARIIRNVHVGPSPGWLTGRLETMGTDTKPVRGINNIVDVTNYVMFEMGQPLHAFDFDRLEGGRIVVRRAQTGEKLVTIDGKERALTPDMLVIADARRPVALAGVMGGRDTEVTDQTRNVLLESARFDPLSIRRTARALAMASDSSYRFERGIEPNLPARASLRAADLISRLADGQLLSGAVETGEARVQPRKISLRLARLAALLGVELPSAQVMNALTRLRLSPVLHGGQIEVTVPSDRLDLNVEVDLIEEVARTIGYDKVPVRDEIAIRLTPPDPSAEALASLHAVLVAAGYFEAVTFSFVDDRLAGDFAAKPQSLPRADSAVRKADARLRPSLLPGLLQAVRTNQSAGNDDPRLYEIGSVFWTESSGAIGEQRRLGLVGSSDLREVRGVVEAILRKLDATRAIEVKPHAHPGFAAAAAGRIEWGGKAIGHIGKIDGTVADKLSLPEAPAAAELDMAALLAGAKTLPALRPLPRFPAVRRDLSLIVPEGTPYEQIASLVRTVNPPWLEDLEFVTTYRGKPLSPDQKSVTITLVFRSPDETLTSENVETSVQRVTEAATRDLGATLRT